MAKTLLFLICALSLFALSSEAQSFQYSRAVTIQASQVANSDETNFPVYVVFTDPGLKSAANGGHVQSATGADISFFSDSRLTQLLSFELVSYNPSAGSLTAVILCPTLSHSQNTVFYLAYGSTSMTSSAANPTAVWAGYAGVFHLEDNAASTSVYNSASGEGQASNGTSLNNTSGMSTAGQLGSGLSLNGSADKFDFGPYAVMNGSAALTYSGWINFRSLADYAVLIQRVDSAGAAGSILSLAGHWTTSNQDWLTAVRST